MPEEKELRYDPAVICARSECQVSVTAIADSSQAAPAKASVAILSLFSTFVGCPVEC
jgi:hypothetical protein